MVKVRVSNHRRSGLGDIFYRKFRKMEKKVSENLLKKIVRPKNTPIPKNKKKVFRGYTVRTLLMI